YIMDMMEEEGNAEIRRKELADRFGCVPSQINYVITSRFTPEQGYIVESRRGGGGYIRISRIQADKSTTVMHIINSIGDSLDNITARVMINNLKSASIIGEETANLFLAAMSERSLSALTPEARDRVRASMCKNMLLAIM
ncbi:MAG: CtsR family transcriptional regulator, partial [Ruminococcus sp.]